MAPEFNEEHLVAPRAKSLGQIEHLIAIRVIAVAGQNPAPRPWGLEEPDVKPRSIGGAEPVGRVGRKRVRSRQDLSFGIEDATRGEHRPQPQGEPRKTEEPPHRLLAR